MALRINLYHEVIRAKKQEKYDPLRLSMIGLAIIGTGLAALYVAQYASMRSAKSAFIAKQAEYSGLAARSKAAGEEGERLAKEIELTGKFRKRIEGRFYWAPVFEQIVAVVPPNVQLTKCSGDVTLDGARRCQLTLDGIAAGEEPRDVAEKVRVALVERLGAKYSGAVASFKTLEDGSEKVMFEGRRLFTATFSISVSFSAGPSAPVSLAKKN
jgi:Tfp pilus assembly protein PilN